LVSPREANMDTNTLLIILVVLLLIGGGGFYGRGRWY
jgi:LPXTG-motif cell wall-anchored protein